MALLFLLDNTHSGWYGAIIISVIVGSDGLMILWCRTALERWGAGGGVACVDGKGGSAALAPNVFRVLWRPLESLGRPRVVCAAPRMMQHPLPFLYSLQLSLLCNGER